MIRFEELKSIHVELSSACNAACPNCPRNVYGGYTLPGLKPKTMSLAEFQTIFTPSVLHQIEHIMMCGNYGDPVYCVDLPRILEYIRSVDSSITIRMNTNGGVRGEKWWADLANAYPAENLKVVFSVDGLADTNHIYRRNVNWDSLMTHMRSFIGAGGTAVWEFLVFAHNEHQIGEAQEVAAELGVSEILFKKPFGFETIHSGVEEMTVLDRDGNYDYSIYPAEKYRHGVMSSGQLRKDNQFNLPPENYMAEIEDYHRVRAIVNFEKEDMSKHDDVEISCMTKNTKEIYIDSKGIVHPCCFLGVNYGANLKSADYIQYSEWLESTVNMEQINALHHPLEEIMQQSYMDEIEKNWSGSHRGDRLMCCTRMCAVKKGIKDGLYA
jgi:MoaA/NifB/PqqE/SkfB family radical SAM enzyme